MTCHIVWLPPLSVLHPPRPPCPTRVPAKLRVGPRFPRPPLVPLHPRPILRNIPVLLSRPAPMLMSSLVALQSFIRPQLKTPPGAKAKQSLRHSLLVLPLLKSRTPLRPPPVKGPPPLPSASRRFYALRTVQVPHPDEALIRIRRPDLAASVLREANFNLPVPSGPSSMTKAPPPS